MTENETFIYESIVNQVRMGFLPISEIIQNTIEEVEDNQFEDEISENWMRQKISTEVEKLKIESRNWKNPTDTIRLQTVFNELINNNIIALHCAGYSTSDGEYEVVEVEQQLQDNGVVSDGYCFYHEQDLQRAIESNCLMLAFQKVDNSDDAVTIDIGKKIVKILKENGFEVNWNETVNQKIEILNFKWQKIFSETDDNLLDYSIVVEQLLK